MIKSICLESKSFLAPIPPRRPQQLNLSSSMNRFKKEKEQHQEISITQLSEHLSEESDKKLNLGKLRILSR